MAKQESIFILKGTIGGVTFYKSTDGYLAKEKTSLGGERFKSDPRFARSLENWKEFKRSALVGKVFKDAIKPFIKNASDSRVTGRITQLMSRILKEDFVSIRGQRHPANGINSIASKHLLKGFNFNKNAILSSVLKKTFFIDPTSDAINITSLNPTSDIEFPPGASHLKISAGILVIDLATKIFDFQQTNLINIEKTDPPLTGNLTPAIPPNGLGVKMYLLKLEFYQEVNGLLYSFENGGFNAMEIVEVS